MMKWKPERMAFVYSMVQSPTWEANWSAASQETLDRFTQRKVKIRRPVLAETVG